VRVAITGGSGFVGTHLTRMLTDSGHQVVVISRGTKRRPRRANVSFVKADLTDSPVLVDAFGGCDAVIHLVAVIRERGRQTFQRVNAEASERVADAARQAKVPHLIHQSAIGADPDPRYPYLASKWQGEQAVRGSGVPYTVFRPSLIFGPGDGFFTLLTRLIRRNPVVPIPGDGQALFQPIAIEDVVRCYRIVLERGPQQAVHEIGGPEHLTYEELVLTIRRGLGLYRRTAHVPVRMMLPLAFVMDALLRSPPVTPQQLRLLERNNITRLDSVPAAFDFQPQRFADNLDYLEDY
jgi:NADH dehydrogenase